jgi:hypothetical protein
VSVFWEKGARAEGILGALEWRSCGSGTTD